MEHIPTIIASMMFRDNNTWSYNFLYTEIL